MVFETERSYNKEDLCHLIILIHHLIGCSRKNREESKEKILGKKRETYLNTMKEYVNKFEQIYNILELYYQTELDQP